MDDDAALLYGVSPHLHTRCSNVLTASFGVDGLNRLIPASPEEYPFAPQRATMRRAVFTIALFWVVLVGAVGQTFAQTSPNHGTAVSTLPAASAFTNVYGIYGTNFITIAPWTSQGIFYQGDPITISNRIGTTIEVYDFHSNPVTNHAPPVTLTNLPMGHYFVQVDGANGGFGDRAQFSIWPKGYTNHPHSDIGITGSGTYAESNRMVRVAPGEMEYALTWGQENATGGVNESEFDIPYGLIKTNGNIYNTNTYDWAWLDQFLNGGPPYYAGLWGGGNLSYTNMQMGPATSVPNPPVPVKLVMLFTEHTTNFLSYEPTVDYTNNLSSWANDIAITYSNMALRYGTKFYYQILNEPNFDNTPFTTSQGNPYGYTNSGGDVVDYPASLAVSAAAQAVHYVCPNCQVWAPDVQGFDAAHLSLLTNSYVIPGYTNIAVITYHDGCMQWGPEDSECVYSNTSPRWIVPPINWFDATVYAIYHKPFYITEWYPASPDALGKTNNWFLNATNSMTQPSSTWNWYTMNMRWWKDIILGKANGVMGIEGWILGDTDCSATNPPTASDGSDYGGWPDGGEREDISGCGPRPTVDGQAMISWWLTGATPIAHWLSGGPLTVVDPLGGYTNGPPGLHFWEWRFANGTTNTFIWADEQTTVTTNFGAGLTDIFSNRWNGPIGIEPVIAWGWPNNSLGGSFSIVAVAAFGASPTHGPAAMTVTFTDDSAGAITNRSWQFGDGFVTNTPELTVVHRYTKPGSNTVQLIVSGPSGASTNTQSNMVIVTPVSLHGGGSNGLPPVIGGAAGGSAGGTNSIPPAGGAANSSWRLLITY